MLKALSVLGLALWCLQACSEPFSSCRATRTCPSQGGSAGEGGESGDVGGSAGDLGDAGAGGALGGAGGAENAGGAAGAVGAGEAGAGEAGASGLLSGACDEQGVVACTGASQKESLICEQGQWIPYETCGADENCDRETGSCEKIVPGCGERAPGATFCDGDTLVECGPDLVTAEETVCDGVCAENSEGAECLAPSCSDHKVEPPEQCDDGNAESGDGCSEDCKWEVKNVVTGDTHSCVLTEGGEVKCWGDNFLGQLGLGDTDAHGDAGGEMGGALPAVDLGPNHTAKAIFAGGGNTCALLDDDSLTCWGGNWSGQLGQGDTENRGDQKEELGDALPRIPLGPGRVARDVVIGDGGTICALLDDSTVKCWGNNAEGQLGLGDKAARGDTKDETVYAQTAVALGAEAQVQAVAVGTTHACALLVDGAIKCWGDNVYGQLGLGDTLARGDEYAEMGDNLPAVELGAADGARLLTVSASISLGYRPFTCAVRNDETLACWGWLEHLGFPETSIGDDATELGDALPTLPLGSRRTVRSMGAGWVHLCALLDDNSVKCWGNNYLGQVGHASSADSTTTPEPVALGQPVMALSVGSAHNCAVLRDRSVKCWGYNNSGQLGLGDTRSRGFTAAELGDALPSVDLGL